MTAGEQLRVWRRGQGITQRVLAMRIGVTNQTVSDWETGVRPPSIANAEWLARHARIPVTAWRSLPSGNAGADMRAWRIRNGVTQAQMAGRIGCSETAVGAWERGERNPLPICTQRIERITGIPVEAWLEMRRAS